MAISNNVWGIKDYLCEAHILNGLEALAEGVLWRVLHSGMTLSCGWDVAYGLEIEGHVPAITVEEYRQSYEIDDSESEGHVENGDIGD